MSSGLVDVETADSRKERLEAVCGMLACHGSVRAARRLTQAKMNVLLRQM